VVAAFVVSAPDLVESAPDLVAASVAASIALSSPPVAFCMALSSAFRFRASLSRLPN